MSEDPLWNATPEFHRYMEYYLKGLRDNIFIPHLDDIIVFSKTFLEHVENVQTVLPRLWIIKLNAKNCKLFKREVAYLGRIVSADGYRVGQFNTQAMLSLKKTKPRTVGDVRKPLGLLWVLPKVYPGLFELLKTPGIEPSDPTTEKGRRNRKGNRM